MHAKHDPSLTYLAGINVSIDRVHSDPCNPTRRAWDPRLSSAATSSLSPLGRLPSPPLRYLPTVRFDLEDPGLSAACEESMVLKGKASIRRELPEGDHSLLPCLADEANPCGLPGRQAAEYLHQYVDAKGHGNSLLSQ